MKYYIIAGEASGDLHGSSLMNSIRLVDSHAQFRVWGGDLMEQSGVEPIKHIRDLAFMGFTEVLLNLKTIRNNLKFCKADLKEFQPDAVVLIDYPGFNLRIARFAHQQGFKVFYYISPQVWAWKQSRVQQIRHYVNRMFVILPFEVDFYKNFGIDVTFVGHPLIESIQNFQQNDREKQLFQSEKKIIALLPGSRKQEIKRILPVMISLKKHYPEFDWIIAGAPAVKESFYREICDDPEISIVFKQTYALLSQSYAALVTSGTATLETALFNIPQVVCYKGGKLSYFIGRMVVNKKIIQHISLVNIIARKEVVKELIQSRLNSKALKKELDRIIHETSIREQIKAEYAGLIKMLGSTKASQMVAKELYHSLQQ